MSLSDMYPRITYHLPEEHEEGMNGIDQVTVGGSRCLRVR